MHVWYIFSILNIFIIHYMIRHFWKYVHASADLVEDGFMRHADCKVGVCFRMFKCTHHVLNLSHLSSKFWKTYFMYRRHG